MGKIDVARLEARIGKTGTRYNAEIRREGVIRSAADLGSLVSKIKLVSNQRAGAGRSDTEKLAAQSWRGMRTPFRRCAFYQNRV